MGALLLVSATLHLEARARGPEPRTPDERYLAGEQHLQTKDLAGARRIFQALRDETAREALPGVYIDAARSQVILQRVLERLVELDSLECRQDELKRDLNQLVATEDDLRHYAVQYLSGIEARSLFLALDRDEPFVWFYPTCQGTDPEVLLAQFLRQLIRRELVADSTRSQRQARSLNRELAGQLRGLRKFRSQIALRRESEALAKEIADLHLPSEFEDRPEAGILNPIANMDVTIIKMESILAETPGIAGPPDTDHLWQGIQDCLPSDGALVSFTRAFRDRAHPEPHLFAFVVRRGAPLRLVDLGDAGAADRAAVAAVSAVRSAAAGSPAATEVALRELGKLLFDPLEESFGGSARIALSTSGALRPIPWDALIDRRGAFLLDRFSFFYLESLDDLSPAPLTAASKRLNAAFFGPETRAGGAPADSRSIVSLPRVSQLPRVRQELEDSAWILASSGFKVWLLGGKDATEEKLRKGRPSILHIAAHGFMVHSGSDRPGKGFVILEAPLPLSSDTFDRSGDNLYRTGIFLSDAGEVRPLVSEGFVNDDGLLSAAEAMDLHLDSCALVVLATCGSAQAVYETSAAAYDLARAFRIAGAGAVVGSLWTLDDRAASIALPTFYAALVGGFPADEALALAKRQLRRRPGFQSPFFWAALTLSGNARIDLASR